MKNTAKELAIGTGYIALRFLGVICLVVLPVYLVGKLIKWIFE